MRSADIIIMPIAARPSPKEVGKHVLRVIVDRTTLSRIKAYSECWNLPPDEAAALMLAELVRPKGCKR